MLCITPRERDALQFLADGHTAIQLCRHFELGASEMDSMLEGLFAALGAASQIAAIAAARKRGLLSEPSHVHEMQLGEGALEPVSKPQWRGATDFWPGGR